MALTRKIAIRNHVKLWNAVIDELSTYKTNNKKYYYLEIETLKESIFKKIWPTHDILNNCWLCEAFECDECPSIKKHGTTCGYLDSHYMLLCDAIRENDFNAAVKISKKIKDWVI